MKYLDYFLIQAEQKEAKKRANNNKKRKTYEDRGLSKQNISNASIQNNRATKRTICTR